MLTYFFGLYGRSTERVSYTTKSDHWYCSQLCIFWYFSIRDLYANDHGSLYLRVIQ
jgi:hypothetical protein